MADNDQVWVLNVSKNKHSIDLYSADGDSVTVPYSHKQVPIHAKFLTWVKPHPNKIRIMSSLPEDKKSTTVIAVANKPTIDITSDKIENNVDVAQAEHETNVHADKDDTVAAS